jgi:Ca-activated chloride channel family protein
MSRPGTVIGEAIQTAISGFDENLSTQKVIVIFTDGEDRETDALTAAKQAADAGIIIYTVGFGSDEGVPIPQYDAQGNLTGYKQDSNGETVLTRLDDSVLRQIAETTGGEYFSANQTGALSNLLDRINALQSGSLGERFESTGIERFQAFALIAFIALIGIELIPDRRVIKRETRLSWLRFSRKGV